MRSTLQTVPESLPTDHITNPLGTTATTTATTETTTTKSSHSHTSNPLKGRATSTKVCYVKLCFGKLLFFWGPWCTENLLHFKRSCYRLFSYAVSIIDIHIHIDGWGYYHVSYFVYMWQIVLETNILQQNLHHHIVMMRSLSSYRRSDWDNFKSNRIEVQYIPDDINLP